MSVEIKAIVLPYKNFRHRIRLTKEHEKDYKIENLDGYLYMVRREKKC